jgi:hypothetical protein
MMMENRRKAGVVEPRQFSKPPVPEKKKTKTQRAKEQPAGTKQMRQFIIEEKPNKSVVRDHIKAKVEFECESSDEE